MKNIKPGGKNRYHAVQLDDNANNMIKLYKVITQITIEIGKLTMIKQSILDDKNKAKYVT